MKCSEQQQLCPLQGLGWYLMQGTEGESARGAPFASEAFGTSMRDLNDRQTERDL